MENIAKDSNDNHITQKALNHLLKNDSFNLLPSKIKKHLNQCDSCREFMDILEEAKQIAAGTKPDASIYHPSRLDLSETIVRIYDQSIRPREAANFLNHLQTCSQCFEYVGSVFEESLSLLPENIEEELAGYSKISIAEKVLESVPQKHSRKTAELLNIWGKSKQKIDGFFETIRLQPAWGLALVALLVVGIAVGQGPFREWRAGVHTKEGMILLQKTWTVTEDDLRPPGAFPKSIFSITHSTESEETEPAASKFETALGWDENNRAAKRGIAIYWYFRWNSVRADSLLQTLLAQDSLDFEAWNILGLVAARQEDRLKALSAFDKALQIQPDYAEAAYNRALVLQQLGRLEEAKKAWQYYLEIDNQSDWSSVARKRLSSIEYP